MPDRKLPPSGGERKRCTSCKTVKSLNQFYKAATAKDGKTWRCKSCYHEYHKTRRAQPQHSARIWEQQIRRNFGITAAEYYSILSEQGGGCAICGKSSEQNGKRLAVDHCHSSKRIRGILCDDCNIVLGRMGDSIPRLRNAITYLSRS